MTSTDAQALQGTVAEAFARSATCWPDNDCLLITAQTAANYGIPTRRYSYQETADRCAGLRERYRRCGYGHGHRAGLLLENRPAFFFHWLALNALGVSVVPINPEWRAGELEYLIGHAEISVAVAPSVRANELHAAARCVGRVLCVTSDSLEELSAPAEPPPGGDAPPTLDTECALLYTSGTTGRPKGCVLANEYFLWAGEWYANAGGLCRIQPGSERLLTPLPMSHMNAMAFSTMVMLQTGGCIVPLDRFHPRSWWQSVQESQATIVHYLGVMPAMLLGLQATGTDRAHRVRFGFGAGVSPRLHAPFEERFGFPLLEAWAMTETGAGAVVIANREPRKAGSACFGRAAARIEYRIVDEQGTDVPTGAPGELLVRGRGSQPRFGFFREYLKDAASTEAAWQGGYFHTGDVVCVDPEGDLHFIDRRKNVIRRSGENISAVEVEGVLAQHGAVRAVGVTAVPDELRGDEVFACVVPRSGLRGLDTGALARDLVEFALEKLAYFKAPGYVAFCSALPLTATEKIQRAQLKSLADSLRGTAACIDLRALKKRSPST